MHPNRVSSPIPVSFGIYSPCWDVTIDRKQLPLRDFLLSRSLSESQLQQVFWGFNSMQNGFMLNLEVSSVKATMLMGSQEG